MDAYGLDKCNCIANGGGSRSGPVGPNGLQRKFCTYSCNCTDSCGEQYTKTITVPSGRSAISTCKGQWQDNVTNQGGFDDFNIHTGGLSEDGLGGAWDGMFNGDFVDALNGANRDN
jgi:hypothetical protein